MRCLVTRAETSPDVFTFYSSRKTAATRSGPGQGFWERTMVFVNCGGSHGPHLTSEKLHPPPGGPRTPRPPSWPLTPATLASLLFYLQIFTRAAASAQLLSLQILSWVAPSHLSGLSSERSALRDRSEVCPCACPTTQEHSILSSSYF